jgi:flavodoxin
MSSPNNASPGGGNVLLVYFSRAGENYWSGGRRTLATGNTQILAEQIAKRINSDVLALEAADPYPERYDETVARNVDEQNSDARPTIATEIPDLSGYDTVLLGSPIWNVRPPMIMSTFLDAAQLPSTTTLLPFVTYAVSGLGDTRSAYEELAPQVRLGRGLAVRGETVRDNTDSLDRWLNGVGLTAT